MTEKSNLNITQRLNDPRGFHIVKWVETELCLFTFPGWWSDCLLVRI